MRFYLFAFRLFAVLFICSAYFTANAQICPPNIDFEKGNFDGWTCYTGSVAAVNGQNIISLTPSGGPVAERHTMYSANPGDGVDQYGGFPINCPNGSGHSIRLGNNFGGGEAEGISYEFTIPATASVYTLIYNYAVVFQDPNHQENEQPRMEIEITNVTDNTIISCSSFTFRPYGTPLPGFSISPNPGSETPVWYKDWSAVSINLNGNAGKLIRLFFKTSDCTFRRHFGYAYIDVNSECSGTFVGATYCRDDTAVNVIAPYGYQSYTWYNSSLTQVLGTNQVLTFAPPPVAGTTVAVQLEPYNGYGCPQTLYARLVDTLSVIANAGPDVVSCNHNTVNIGAPSKPGLVYKWIPGEGLSNPDIASPLAKPDITTTYVLTTRHDGGGCIDTDTVVVKAANINGTLQLDGSASYCLGSGDSSVLRVQPTDSIQWFRDNIAIDGANQPSYRVLQSGAYYARLFNKEGCSTTTSIQQINISSIPVPGFTLFNPNQCLVGNKFTLTNTSTNALGTMQYQWILGDGSLANTRDVTYTYTRAGTYDIKVLVSSNSVCVDSSMLTVNVYQNAIADFIAKPVCVNLPLQAINNTIDTLGSPVHYLWNFGNGQTSTARTPAPQIYPSAGNYIISLSVNTDQCPSPLNTVRHIVAIDKPRAAVNNPVQYAVINLPLTLQAREFGETALWRPPVNLDNPASYTPVFKGTAQQLYQVEIKTASGCVTVDTQLVLTVKNVEIYVPTAFTPNSDSKNDFLRPILMGIKEVRYFRIFNRWGQLLYEMKTDKRGWDGTISGVAQPTQTVVWVIEGLGLDGKTYLRKGTSVLVR